MKSLVSRLERTVEILMALALAIMAGCVFGNVVLRYAFNTGIAAAEEIARLMFVWLIFLGAILATRRHAHLGVEMLQAALPPSARKVCAVASHLLILYALWLFLHGSWTQTVIGMNIRSTVLGYPTALMAAAGLLCAATMMLIVANNLLLILTGHPAAVVPGTPAPHDDTSPKAAPAHPQGALE
ncbi:TRAP transporter small permease [Noviherbaspirillum denitrificans]|uniref:TRAP transporter small permease protein n=1 Tax=Noviherbaspirillum denitrificans TaxID=1968433 RepID=A0A254TE86_9BURK|nr:TRAP transporter small permease [Noviherbaspirillum denitrificans]OWW20966.1 C4-dicarboxylate ABC transporter permease [Noviherbaspirillum denitrificans]